MSNFWLQLSDFINQVLTLTSDKLDVLLEEYDFQLLLSLILHSSFG